MATVYTISKSPTDSASSYTVKSGDTLSGIASRLGVDQGSITGYRSGNPNLIYPGEVLSIGQSAPKAQTVNFQQPEQPAPIVPSDPGTVSQPEMQGLGTRYGINIPQPSPAPARPNLVEKYQSLVSSAGIEDLTKQVSELDAAIANEQARARQFAAKARTNPTYADTVSGKISQDQRAAQEQIDFLSRQKNTLVSAIQSKQDTIRTIMDLTGKDYQIASDEYGRDFENSMKVYNALSAGNAKENVLADNARANLTIIANKASEGGFDFANLSDQQRVAINKLEMQAGLPTGFVANIRATKSADNIKSITTRTDAAGNKYADIIRQSPDGRIYITNEYLGKGAEQKGQVTPEQRTQQIAAAKEFIAQNPDATPAELELGIRQNTNLSDADIKLVLANEKQKRFITHDFLRTQFANVSIDQMLKTLGKQRSDYSSLFSFASTEEANIRKDFDALISGIMPVIEQYRASGKTDAEIMEIMQKK